MCQPALHMSSKSIFPSSIRLWHTWHWVSSGGNSNPHGFELHRPSIKGTKLLFKILKAIIIIDHAHTDQTLKTASTYSKHCKRWVGRRTAPREHVQRISGCRRGGGLVSIYVQPFIASLHRAGAREHLAKFPGQVSETFNLVS